MKKILKKMIACIMVMLFFAQITSMPVLATENLNHSVVAEGVSSIDNLRAEFKKVFPEYTDRIAECDELVRNSQSGIMLLNEEEERVVDKITRKVGNETYTLTFYSDGGYSEVALFEPEVTISFVNGTEYQAYYRNCRVTTFFSDPGIIAYTGGMIGDTISYYKTGVFYNGEYGNYINAGVQPGYESDVTFLSRASNEVQVLGKATALVYTSDYSTVLTKDLVLRIRLNAGDPPQVEFGYLEDIIN